MEQVKGAAALGKERTGVGQLIFLFLSSPFVAPSERETRLASRFSSGRDVFLTAFPKR
jgi:hypothetical protein